MKCQACVYFAPDMKNPYFGWCSHTENRIPPSYVFPLGTRPSTAVSHGCDKGKDTFVDREVDKKETT